jgi:hypothetical protein
MKRYLVTYIENGAIFSMPVVAHTIRDALNTFQNWIDQSKKNVEEIVSVVLFK